MQIIQQIKHRIAGIIFPSLEYFQLASGAIYDFRRYFRFSITGWRRSLNQRALLEALIIKEYHVIEKGLSMPDFRYRFGISRISQLVDLMRRYRAAEGEPSNPHYLSAILCLKHYMLRHVDGNVDISDILTQSILSELMGGLEVIPEKITGGVIKSSPRLLFAEQDSPFGTFASSRKSCRNFDPTKLVDGRTIEAAILIARNAPSVCNRQAWRVHSYFNREHIDQILSHQNGNRGFGHHINCLLIVTTNLECFTSPIERYQMWIDGGMFGMMLLLALHHLGLGTIALNWSVLPASDLNLRKSGRIPEMESIIMLIGVGHPSEDILLANSQRRNLSEIYFNHSTLPI
jgi:nitroreductase